jgi:hypothetical protein
MAAPPLGSEPGRKPMTSTRGQKSSAPPPGERGVFGGLHRLLGLFKPFPKGCQHNFLKKSLHSLLDGINNN